MEPRASGASGSNAGGSSDQIGLRRSARVASTPSRLPERSTITFEDAVEEGYYQEGPDNEVYRYCLVWHDTCGRTFTSSGGERICLQPQGSKAAVVIDAKDNKNAGGHRPCAKHFSILKNNLTWMLPHVHWERSDDQGKTWKVARPLTRDEVDELAQETADRQFDLVRPYEYRKQSGTNWPDRETWAEGVAAWRHEWAEYDSYSKEGEIEDLAANATPDAMEEFKVIGYRLAPLSVTGYGLNYQGYHDLS